MKKHFLKIIILLVVCICPSVVKADFGDLRYEVTDVEISAGTITFKGWAFIHKTNNFVSVTKSNGTTVDTGDQKIMIRARTNDEVIETQWDYGSDKVNYNFYCELFYKGYKKCTKENYRDYDYNTCNGNDANGSQCYYEDMYFAISFDTSEWSVYSDEDIQFEIAVSNNFYENKVKGKEENCENKLKEGGDCYTPFEKLSIARANVSGDIFNNKYFDIEEEDLSTTVKYIASSGLLYEFTPNIYNKSYFTYSDGGDCTYGAWSAILSDGESNVYNLKMDLDPDVFAYGRSIESNKITIDGREWIGSRYYALKVAASKTNKGKACVVAMPATNNDVSCDKKINRNCYRTVLARGSHVKSADTFIMKINNDKKCEVKDPRPDSISCNSSGTLSSTCEELTVKTKEGSANVKIEQVGTVSSVLTPDRIYQGGGFKFGIMYYNNIKWSYVKKKPSDKLHEAVSKEMNKKIKDYNEYIASINIPDLKYGGKLIKEGMVKKCTTSSDSKDYYGDNGLTVSCVFTFPDSDINLNGEVKYAGLGSSSLNVNNRYYTSLGDNGYYDITAAISGMDRITAVSATKDSAESNKPWTGEWEVSIEDSDGCRIKVYPLLYSNNFIYRPIDINNPFPNRNAGINWFDWYANNRNKQRLENTYLTNPKYTAILDNNAISDIKKYNKEHNYLEWDSIDEDGESSFINEKNYIVRGGS